MPRRSVSNTSVLDKSVTKGDYNTTPYGGYYNGVYQLTLPYLTPQFGDLPAYWNPYRDRVLKTTPMRESMWASAIGIATSKVAASDWRLDGRKIKYWQDLMLAADNDHSFVSFEEKQIRDYLLTCNGTFVELVRVADARGARLAGIQHLPSWRCLRTGDPDIPVIYRDRRGVWHEMKDYQVVEMSDEPDPDDIYFGVGHCAAERAWNAIIKLSALELYVYEKISGKTPSRVYLVNANINEKQLANAIDTSKERSNEKGYVMYMDAVMIPILDPNATASVASIDLKGLPEGFDPEKERIHAMLTYADAIGLDPVELDPNLAARGRALGSGSQAQVLDDKQSGRGLVSYFKKKAYLYNEYVLPDRVTFFFGSNDLVDSGRRADIFLKHVEAVRQLVGTTDTAYPIITPEQGKQLLAEQGDIPHEFLAGDLTADETLRDDEKPSDLDEEPIEPVDQKLMLTEPPQPPQPTGAFGAKPAASKQSFNQYLAEKAYNAQVNAAEEWASQVYPHWFMLSEKELLELHQAQQIKIVTPKPKRLKRKENTTPPVILPTTMAQPQMIVVQSPPPNVEIHMPDTLTLKETKPTELHVTQDPIQLTIQLPELPTPQVTVTNNVPVPEVKVENNVQSPDVSVDVPASVVNVTVPETPVHVTVQPAESKTVVQSPETLRVIRGPDGLIKEVVKE